MDYFDMYWAVSGVVSWIIILNLRYYFMRKDQNFNEQKQTVELLVLMIVMGPVGLIFSLIGIYESRVN